MKKLMLSLATAVMLLGIGCNKSEGDPKAVLTSFFEALSKKDIDEAKKHATKESTTMLDYMKMGMSNAKAETDKKDDEFNKDNMTFGEPKITGDQAVIAVTEKKTGKATNFKLKKEDGKWKVAFDKASMMESFGEGLNNGGSLTPDNNSTDTLPGNDGGNMMNDDSTNL